MVTGGGSGIGRAAALGLARDGVTVAIIGRTETSLAETAAIGASFEGRLTPFPCDIGDNVETAKTFAKIDAVFGRVDFLLNAAGLYRQAPLAEFDMDGWKQILDTNLYGPALAMRQVLPGMLARDFGRMVTLGSRSARSAGAVTSAYSASKAGVEALTQAVAHEILWHRKGRPDVQANVLYPGQTVTGLLPGEIADPARYQTPDDVYPYIRALLLRPRWAGMGQTIYRTRIISRGGWRLVAKQLRANMQQAVCS